MSSPSSFMTRGRILALVVLVVAVALRAWDINARALWFDEASEYWVATAALSDLARAVRDGSGDPPLYAFLLHAWSRIGDGEIWLRSLSVVFSIAGLLGVMAFARRVSGWAAAVAAGTMVALSPADIRYAQEVGQYALMPAAITWSLLSLWQLANGGRWKWILAWVASSLAASYAYYGAVLTVMAPFACVVAEAVLARDVRRRRTTGTALVLYVIGVIPLVVYFLPAQLSRVVADTATVAAPETGGIAAAWQWLRETIAFQFTGWPYTDVPAAVPVLATLLLCAFAARAHRRVLAWLVASWACYGIADAAGLFPHGYRWGLILFPLLVSMAGLGAAAGGRARRTTALAMASLSVLALSSIVSLPHRSVRDRLHADAAWAWPETEDMRAMVAHWREHRAPARPTYVYYGAAPAFAYYTRAIAPRENLPPTWHLSCWHDPDTPAFCRADGIYYGRWLRRLTPEQRVTSVFETLGERPRAFWLVFSHMQPGDDRDLLAGIVRMGYRIESAAQGRDAAVFLVSLP